MELSPMYRGDSRIIRMTTTTNLYGGKLYFIVKELETDEDNKALLNKEWDLDTPVSNQVFGATIELFPQETDLFTLGSVFVGIEYVAAPVLVPPITGVEVYRTYTIYAGTMKVNRDLRRRVGFGITPHA
jgi:hypothetical protein